MFGAAGALVGLGLTAVGMGLRLTTVGIALTTWMIPVVRREQFGRFRPVRPLRQGKPRPRRRRVAAPPCQNPAMPEDHFGGRVAARYDETSAEMFAPAAVRPVIDFLTGLAGEGAALELGIGTGRIALPLAGRASAATASTSRRRWWRGCGPSRAATRSATSR